MLLVVEWGAVHVARLPIGFAAEAQDGGVVDEAVGDGHRLRGRRQEFPPVLERKIRDHHRGFRPIPGADDPEELVGGLAAEVGEARVVKLCGAPHNLTNGERSVMWSAALRPQESSGLSPS